MPPNLKDGLLIQVVVSFRQSWIFADSPNTKLNKSGIDDRERACLSSYAKQVGFKPILTLSRDRVMLASCLRL